MSTPSDHDTEMGEGVGDYDTLGEAQNFDGVQDDPQDKVVGDADAEGESDRESDSEIMVSAELSIGPSSAKAINSAGTSGSAAAPGPSVSAGGQSSNGKRGYRRRAKKERDLDLVKNPPPFIGAMRQSLFELSEPVELKPEEFSQFWPYVDNVWVRQHRAGTDRAGKATTDYYACRLQRPTYTPKENNERDESKPRRKKKAREGGTCQVRIKTVHYVGAYQKVTIMRVGAHSHSHDLDAIDRLKRNTVVMDVARTEVQKGFLPGSVFSAMRQDPARLAVMGGKFMKVNDVRNASQTWRTANPGITLKPHPDAMSSMQTAFRDETAAPALPQLASAAQYQPVSTSDAPKSSSATTLPPDTLFFPPHSNHFLQPYLPASEPGPGKPGIPYVTLSYAASLDSLLAIDPMVPTAISSLPTKAMTHYLRSRHDAILIGVGTAIADDPTLNCRLAGAGGYGGVGWSSHPRPVIIDPGARWELSTTSKILQAAKDGRGRAPWVVVQPTAKVPATRIELLQQFGGKYVMLPEVDARYRLRWNDIFRALFEEGIRSVMVEGGATVASELLGWEETRRLVASVIVTVAPTYLGQGGVRVGPTRRYDELGRPMAAMRFLDVRWYPLGDDVVMCGRTVEWTNQNKEANQASAPTEANQKNANETSVTAEETNPDETMTSLNEGEVQESALTTNDLPVSQPNSESPTAAASPATESATATFIQHLSTITNPPTSRGGRGRGRGRPRSGGNSGGGGGAAGRGIERNSFMAANPSSTPDQFRHYAGPTHGYQRGVSSPGAAATTSPPSQHHATSSLGNPPAYMIHHDFALVNSSFQGPPLAASPLRAQIATGAPLPQSRSLVSATASSSQGSAAPSPLASRQAPSGGQLRTQMVAQDELRRRMVGDAQARGQM